jgi:hypothetical protein
MSPLTIVIIVVIIVLIFMILRYYLTDNFTLQSSVASGKTSSTIEASSLATGDGNAPATNFTYSFWFYINDWNYRYGHKKVLFGRMASKAPGGGTPTPDASGNNSVQSCAQAAKIASNIAGSGSIENIKQLEPCPAVILGAMENNIAVALSCFSSPESQMNGSSSGSREAFGGAGGDGGNTTVHTCAVTNIPIQRWVNLIISVYGRTLDIYIDGKLVRTCLLPGIASVKNNANIFVTPMGGFDGWTSKLQYWPNSFNPQQAWNTYTQGYRSSMFGTDYQVQVSLLENGTSQGTYTI